MELEAFVKKYDSKVDKEVLEMFKDMGGDLAAELKAKSMEEVNKVKSTLKSLGIDFDKLQTPEEYVALKAKIMGAETNGKAHTENKKAIVGSFIKTFIGGNGTKEGAESFLKSIEARTTKGYEKEIIEATKGFVNTATFQGGGAIIPEAGYDQFIEFLRAQSFLDALGIRKVVFKEGVYTIPKFTKGTTSGAKGEGGKTAVSTPKFSQLRLTPVANGQLVPISKNMLGQMTPEDNDMIMADCVAAVTEFREKMFLVGKGTDNEPTGIWNMATDANKSATAGTAIANIITDITFGPQQLELNNIKIVKGGYIFNPKQWWSLYNTAATNGAFLFRDEMKLGTLNTYGVHKTNHNANDVDGTNKNRLYFVDADKLIMATNREMAIEMFREGSYTDPVTQETISLMQNDLAAIKIIEQLNYGAKYDEAIAVKYDIAW